MLPNKSQLIEKVERDRFLEIAYAVFSETMCLRDGLLDRLSAIGIHEQLDFAADGFTRGSHPSHIFFRRLGARCLSREETRHETDAVRSS